MDLHDLLIPSFLDVPNQQRWGWGTVTQVNPLRVRMDGDTIALSTTPTSLTGPLQVNQRVWVQLYGHRLIILGSAGGLVDTGWINISPLGDWYVPGGQSAQYRKIGNEVFCRGFLGNNTGAGNTQTTAFTFPTGFRPSIVCPFPQSSNTTATMYCQVEPDGDLIEWCSATTSAWRPLGAIRFRVD